MKRGLGLLVVGALCAPATAAAQDLGLSRVTKGPGAGLEERFTEMELSSADGTRAVFLSSEDIMGNGDVDTLDFFERVGDVTRQMTPFAGAHGFPALWGASADGSQLAFSSNGRWTADDTDNQQDVFAVRGGVVERVSQGPLGGNQIDFDAEVVGLSGDGSRALFESAENLTADDTDFRRNDIFLRENGITTRVSTGPNGGNDQWHAQLRGQSADASVLVLSTGERLTADDTDDQNDLFVRAGGTTTKITPGNGPINVSEWPDGVTPDGRTIVFNTPERLTSDDTDDRGDAYRVSDGTIRRVSTGPLGGNDNGYAVGSDPDGSIPTGDVISLSDDGRRVLFYTSERLTADDTDTLNDAYVWSPSGVERVPGHPAGASADGSVVVTASMERLTPDDLDNHTDLFASSGGVLQRVTTGPSGGNAPVDITCRIPRGYCGGFTAISDDGSRIFFDTQERLVPADTDDTIDVYQRAGGVTTLLSPARAGHPVDKDVTYVDGALDGSIVYVETAEQLTADDSNTRLDAYRVYPPAGQVPVAAPAVHPDEATTGQAQPGTRVRLRGRPRTLRLGRGATRLVRRGRGVPFSLPRRAVVLVTIKPLCRCARVVPALRLKAAAGRQVLRLGSRLPGGRRLRAGRYRIGLAVLDDATRKPGPAAALVVRLLPS